MKKTLSLCAFVLLANATFAQKTGKAPPIYDLKAAIEQKLIQVQIEGKGGHEGETLKIICKNLKGQYFRLRIPQGQLIEPADPAQQTLVVAQEQMLAVMTKSPAEANLYTFCTQSGEISPPAAAAFSVGAMASAQLCNVLKFMVEKGKIEAGDAQTAVWCITGGATLGAIGDGELTRFVAEQLGKEVPGYRIKHSTVEHVAGRPAELGKALVIEGNFSYFFEKDERVLMVLLDSTGKLIKQISKEEVMKAGMHRAGMRLEVYNLNSGKYTLRMQTKAGRVIKDTEVEF